VPARSPDETVAHESAGLLPPLLSEIPGLGPPRPLRRARLTAWHARV